MRGEEKEGRKEGRKEGKRKDKQKTKSKRKEKKNGKLFHKRGRKLLQAPKYHLDLFFALLLHKVLFLQCLERNAGEKKRRKRERVRKQKVEME